MSQRAWSMVGSRPGERRTALWVLTAMAGLSSNAQPGVTPLAPAPGTQAPQPDLAQPRVTPAMAADAWDEQRWADAANLYRVLARESPGDALFQFRLAYALHADGQFRRAVAAHQRAAEFPEYRAVSLYNLGCAHASLGNIDRAFEALHEALDAGFDDRDQMARDEDLYVLHDDPRWNELLHGHDPTVPPVEPEPPRWASVPREVEFLLGEWEVLDDRGRRSGSLSIHPEHDGHAIIQTWRGDDRSTGTAMLFYDGVADGWRQVGIDSDGVVVDLSGRAFREEIRLEGEVHTPRGDAFLQEVTIEMRRNGNVDAVTRESEDDGRSWRTIRTSVWRRLGIVPPGRPEPGAGRPIGWKPGLAGPK